METLFFIFVSMLFAHVVADFWLQGILADMKQRRFWRKAAVEVAIEKHKDDIDTFGIPVLTEEDAESSTPSPARQGDAAYFRKKYKYDWVVSLFLHSLEWTYLVMLPVAIWLGFRVSALFIWMFVVNIVFHMIIDHLKANKLRINLVLDQALHIVQIVFTFVLICCVK